MVRRRLCGCGQHRSPGQDNQLPDVEAFAAPRKCDRVPVRVQSAWNGQGCAPNIAACTGQHSFRTRAGVQTIRPITLGSRGSGQPANTPKSNTRVHQSVVYRPQPNRGNPQAETWHQHLCHDLADPLSALGTANQKCSCLSNSISNPASLGRSLKWRVSSISSLAFPEARLIGLGRL